MLEWLLPYMSVTENARSLPAYRLFLKNQHRFIHEKYRRYLSSEGYEFKNVRLLRYILDFIDFDYLDRCANNYERYRNHLRYIRDNLVGIFDHLNHSKSYHQLFFFDPQFTTDEFLIPTEDLDMISLLPMDSERWSDWCKVQPLYLWTHDSNEFSINLMNDRFQFSYAAPSYAILLLNVTALVLKYYIWKTYQRDHEPAYELALYTPQQFFIHRYVLAGLVWDMADAWLINMFKSLTLCSEQDLSDYDARNLQVDDQYGHIAANSRTGFTEVWKLLNNTRKTLQPIEFCQSPLLYRGSFASRIQLAESTLAISPLRQYTWLRWLRDRDLFNIVVRIFLTRPDSPTTKTMLRDININLARLIKQRPWNNCNNLVLKNTIENEMLTTYQLYRR